MKLRKDKWERRKLKTIMSFKNGFNFNKGQLENGWKVIGVSDFQDYFYPIYGNLETLVSDKLPSRDYLVENNDILFVRSNGNRDLVGRTLLIRNPPFPITFSAFCIRGRLIDSTIDALFFTFYSKSDLFKSAIKKLVQGTNITNISQGLLSDIEIQIPSLKEQSQIASLFQSINTAIIAAEKEELKLKDLALKIISDLTCEEPKIGNRVVENTSIKRLGEVAYEYAKRDDNPRESKYDKYVGSDSIGRFDFKIEKWQSTKDVSSSMKVFEPNDYLLVRRSLYASDFRERSPRADFSGLCSGDILTIKENNEELYDGYLLLVLNAPRLWEYIVANASGSITRRVKWKDLAVFEISIPDINTQKAIVEIFDTIQRLTSQLKHHKVVLKNLKQNLLHEMFD